MYGLPLIVPSNQMAIFFDDTIKRVCKLIVRQVARVQEIENKDPDVSSFSLHCHLADGSRSLSSRADYRVPNTSSSLSKHSAETS